MQKKLIKVRIECDELYPCYYFDPNGEEVEISEITLKRWECVISEFNVVQKEMDYLLRSS